MNQEVLDSVNNPRHPFGLAQGTVRGFLSLLICMFFWIVLLWPDDQIVRPLLGHFFLMALVLLAFASSPSIESSFLPWLMRVLFVGGSVAIAAYALVQNPEQFRARMTPDPIEFRDWWSIYLVVMASSFGFGIFIRFILGRNNPAFQVIRAWLSLVGMILLALEIGLFIAWVSADNKQEDFFRVWQAVEIGVVTAYFGTRA